MACHLSPARQYPEIRRRSAVVGRRRSGFARTGAPAWRRQSDPRAPGQITRSLADIIRSRLLMIAAGYEDGNDAGSLQTRSYFQDGVRSAAVRMQTVFAVGYLATGRSARYSRLVAHVARQGRSSSTGPSGRSRNGSRSTSTTPSMPFMRPAVAPLQCTCFQPIVVFDGKGRFITPVLRPAKRPGGKGSGNRAFLRRLRRGSSAPTG